MNRFTLLLLFAVVFAATGLFSGEHETKPADAPKPVKVLEYPGDLRKFRLNALKADGAFAPDMAFTVRFCTHCNQPYVFGTFPRTTRAPFNDLAAVHSHVQAAVDRPAPKTIYSPKEGKLVPRACPYCGTLEGEGAFADRAYFCHMVLESGEDFQIGYALSDHRITEKTYYRVKTTGEVLTVKLPDETEASFHREFGHHFALRAVWRNIFAKYPADSTEIFYEEVEPGLFYIFRPEKVSNEAFQKFADTRLKADRDAKKFTRLESMLKLDKETEKESYIEWAGEYGSRLGEGNAEAFVGISFPELRSAAATVIATRRATLVLSPGNPSLPGEGYIERDPFRLPTTLAPLIPHIAVGGLSLHQVCSGILEDGSYLLDSAQLIRSHIEANLSNCEFEIVDGRYLLMRDEIKTERKIDLLKLANKFDPRDLLTWTQFRDRVLKWVPQSSRFGSPPLERQVSPAGLPAFIERRIRPAEYLESIKLTHAIFEPLVDRDGKRCDLCYTCEDSEGVRFIDPNKPAFSELTSANAIRPLYFEEGGQLPMYIDGVDGLTFPGRLPGVLECKVPIFVGRDVSSLAGEAGRAAQLAGFGNVPQVTQTLSFYALSTNLAALSPRPLSAEEIKLVKSRAERFVTETHYDPGLELNLHFDLPWEQPKGTLRTRK